MRRGEQGVGRPGFTLVEVLLALTVLAVGMLSLSAAVGVVASKMNSSLLETRVTTAAQGQLEDLLARPFDAPASGGRRVGDLEISWWVSGGDPREVGVVATGWLAGSQVTDTLMVLAGRR